MKKYIIYFVAVLLFAVSCGEKQNPKEMTNEELHALAIEIQKEFSYLNMQSKEIEEIKYEKLAHNIHDHRKEINEIRDSMKKDHVSREILIKSAKLYDELLSMYKNAGFKINKIQSKVDRMKTGLDLE